MQRVRVRALCAGRECAALGQAQALLRKLARYPRHRHVLAPSIQQVLAFDISAYFRSVGYTETKMGQEVLQTPPAVRPAGRRALSRRRM